MSEDPTDSEPEEEKDGQNYKVTESEDENEDGTDKDEAEDETGYREDKEADDDDEDEDYDEVVVKPRPLNEVTSLTDKTSPWTSILSDPELVSLESVEEPEDPNLRQDEDEKRKMLNLQTPNCSVQHQCGRREESDSFNGSAGDVSDTDSDDERTLQALDERRAKEANSPNEVSDEKGSSPTTQDATDTHDASCSLVNQDSPEQAYPWCIFEVVFLAVFYVIDVL